MVIARWLMLGLAVLLAGALVFDVVVATRLHTSAGRSEAEAAATTSAFNGAPAQAEKAAEALLSYDYTTLQADADAAKAYLTPSYAETFQKTVDDFLARPAEQSRREVSAMVKASGVVSATPTRVEVLLFVDQTSTTTGSAAAGSAEPGSAQTALNRVLLSMVNSGGTWLVDDVTAL
jgi:Mce-associated membrane protein